MTTASAEVGTVADPAPASPTPPRRRRGPRMDRALLAIIVPVLAFFTIAITLPALAGLVMSLTNSIGFGDFAFIGITNYVALFSDPAVLRSYGFTFGIAIVTVIVVNVVAFALALGLTARIRLQRVLRGVFVLPMVISGIVIAYVFQFLFSNALPAIGQTLGVEALSSSILADESTAWIGIVIVTAWTAVPSTLLIYIAGLVSVPGEVYEASDIDGATGFKRLLHITMPLVAGYVAINLIIGFKNFLNAYEVVLGLTNGGPGTSTRTIAMTIFSGFSDGDYAFQMANAALFFLIVLVVSITQFRLTQRGSRA